MISRILISACAAIILFFGSVHLAYTFFTDKLTAVDGQLETAMKHVAMRITSETTMWKALGRVQRQSQHGPDAVRPNLRLPDAVLNLPSECVSRRSVGFRDYIISS